MSPATKAAPDVFDQYLPLSYKSHAIAGRWSSGIQWLAPTWVGEHRRRLQSYVMLQGYRDNAARLFVHMLTGEDREAAKKRREYGDAALLIETALSKLLGDQQAIVVDGADKFDSAAGAKNTPEAIAADKRQAELRQWADDERLLTKLKETERNAVSFGDGCYSLGWSEAKRRPVLMPWEPDAYFPCLETVKDGDYPSKIILAWELKDEQAIERYGENKTVVHRIVYELVEAEQPWQPKYRDTPATKVCIMTEADFVVSKGARSPEDFDPSSAIYMLDTDGNPIDRKPIGFDFIPFIHVPNTVAEIEHFGMSVLSRVLQLVDDIHAVDSDLQQSSDLTGNPVLVTRGAGQSGSLVAGPGAHIGLTDAGSAEFLSGADGLAGLAKHRDDLLERLAINSRIPAAAQGRANPEKIQAGIILQLSFGPLTSLIDEMRLARADKNRILLKFVQCMMIENGEWDGPVISADITYGAYLPNDVAGTITSVAEAYKAKLISLETAIRMLIEVGVPVDDISDEIAKIQERDFEGGVQLLDALGSESETAKYLGRQIPTDTRPPAPAPTATVPPQAPAQPVDPNAPQNPTQ